VAAVIRVFEVVLVRVVSLDVEQRCDTVEVRLFPSSGVLFTLRAACFLGMFFSRRPPYLLYFVVVVVVDFLGTRHSR